MVFLWTTVLWICCGMCLSTVDGESTPETTLYCRDSWATNMSFSDFTAYSCAKCMVQVFYGETPFEILLPPVHPYLLYDFRKNISFAADPLIKPSPPCDHAGLTTSECEGWRSCCSEATACCQRNQLTKPARLDRCPATWDGISCWSSTPADTSLTQLCPRYFMASHLQRRHPKAVKVCDVNATWYRHELHRSQEMTNYTDCFVLSKYVKILKIGLYIDVVGSSISLVALIIAITMLLANRNLRLELKTRNSLKLHFNLFISVTMMNVFIIVFNCIYLDALSVNSPEQAFYEQNSPWCKVLHYFTQYFRTSTYMCMFCEGLYLYRRISNVMQVNVTESLTKYFIISWGIPAVTVSTYAVCRVIFNQNNSCWFDTELMYLEFIYIIPSILSLICNLVFLVSIEYMLCTKMRSDTSDRRVAVLRHALRATLSLVPIFGLQFLFIIYRPEHWPPYEIISALVKSTQGFFVALLYCFTTKEVRQEMRDWWFDYQHRRRRSRQMSIASSTTKMSRMSFAGGTMDALLARARRLSRGCHLQQNGKIGNAQKTEQSPEIVQLTDTHLSVRQEQRRGSNLSQNNVSQATNATSFVDMNATTTNTVSQSVKVELTPIFCSPTTSFLDGVPDNDKSSCEASCLDEERTRSYDTKHNDTKHNSCECLEPLMARQQASPNVTVNKHDICQIPEGDFAL